MPGQVPEKRDNTMRSFTKMFGAAAILAATVMVPVTTSSATPSETIPVHPMALRGRLNGLPTPAGEAGKPGGGAKTNGISYHGGPVMLGTVNAYIIWYGDWTGTAVRQTIVTDFLSTVSGSPYYNINTTYTNGGGGRVSNSVAYGGSAIDTTWNSNTSSLSDSDIQTITTNAINLGKLPKDANGVYFVLTAAGVSKTGFGTSYCGWHTHANIGGVDIKYSFVGDPTNVMSGCAAQTTSPNGDAPGDAMVSVIAHELEEAHTDPDLNAWYDTRGYENADKCAWTFGTTYSVNGALANVQLGTRNYYIQRNWVNASGGYCSMSY